MKTHGTAATVAVGLLMTGNSCGSVVGGQRIAADDDQRVPKLFASFPSAYRTIPMRLGSTSPIGRVASPLRGQSPVRTDAQLAYR